MMGNSDLNIFVLTILIFFFILSSYFRTQVFYCVQFRDILIGLVIGSFIGFLWYIFVSITETSLKVYDLTYFNTNKENPDKCAMKNKQFRCKKIKTNAENDGKISQLKMEANQAAMAAMSALNSINTKDNFDMIWQLYVNILKKQIKTAGDSIPGNMNKFITADNDGKNITEISNDNVIGYSIDGYKEKIYGISDVERMFDEIIDSSNVYLYITSNENYKYYNNDGTITRSKTKPKLSNVLATNYILFKTFINEYSQKENAPNIITTINNKINSGDYLFPIKILKDNLSDVKDYSKITQYLLSN